jgi:Ribbon-helix-helix protein, copG family
MFLCMRTTLSLDDDVAARIEQLRRELNTPLKELVNEALRRGLAAMHEPCEPAAPYRTRPVDMGRCRLPNVDDVAAALAAAEGESHR